VSFHWGASGFGDAYKQLCLSPSGTPSDRVREVLPRWDNFCRNRSQRERSIRIPVLVFPCPTATTSGRWSKTWRIAGEMLEAAGAKNINTCPSLRAAMAVHEAGIARMGTIPRHRAEPVPAKPRYSEFVRHGRIRIHLESLSESTLRSWLVRSSCDYLMVK